MGTARGSFWTRGIGPHPPTTWWGGGRRPTHHMYSTTLRRQRWGALGRCASLSTKQASQKASKPGCCLGSSFCPGDARSASAIQWCQAWAVATKRSPTGLTDIWQTTLAKWQLYALDRCSRTLLPGNSVLWDQKKTLFSFLLKMINYFNYL